MILLVEDNPDHVALTIRALKKNHIANEVVVATDGAQAIDMLFGRGEYAGRPLALPYVVLLLSPSAPARLAFSHKSIHSAMLYADEFNKIELARPTGHLAAAMSRKLARQAFPGTLRKKPLKADQDAA